MRLVVFMLKPHRMNSLFFSVVNGIALGLVVYGTQIAGVVPYV